MAHATSSADVRAVAVVHKALADPTRLRILQRLSTGDGTVSDLRRHVDLSQPLVSWHLRRLRAAGLVETRRAGREVICSLSREALRRFHDIEHALLGLGG
jgi:ArsR family transcriptional regulator